MRFFLKIILIICLFVISVFSQTESASTINWRNFSPPNEEFSIDFPASPKISNYPSNKLDLRYHSSLNNTFFFISSDRIKDDSQYKTILKFINTFQTAGKQEILDGIKTEKFSFADTEDFQHTVLIAKTKNRVYAFQTISPTKNDSLTEHFFSSLKLTENADLQFYDALHNSIPDEINGENQANTANNQYREPLFPPPPPIKTIPATGSSALSIQSKPTPPYTDLARFYEIDGTSTLKVTFLASGEIGTVLPVTKLPFGLTAKAIEAARNIKFKPVVKDGKPYSVTKTIIYSFTIY